MIDPEAGRAERADQVPAGDGGSVVRAREFVGGIVAVEPAMGDSLLLTMSAPEQMVRQLRAGRFFEVLCRDDASYDPLLRRPFSVFRSDPTASTLTFLVRPYGRGSAWLAERPVGTRLDVLGPLGNTYEIPPRARNLLLVAGGVGAAPLVMLADEAVRRGLSVTFAMGAAGAAGLLEPSLLPSEVEYVVATEDGSKGHRGYVTEVLADYVRWADQIFACGPEPMYRSLRAAIQPLRVGGKPPVQISIERAMACGVGACLACVVETRHGTQASCVDGPVYDLDEVIW
ncbi:MAG: Dihydroorotate dehydrogenase (NAD(+)), electron transfer subunit [uncultured Thermomicrobiales bacterium]|uniref:Dihydroorotate dehydrogenase (NAD(+)), electron transfer subunit n=1 Tax=uncultured Thermomicrobiales bacterium TaxID=1645740 RepID=A0A6J4UHH8_9BACT|nr:MAG: Dihydroorotate dehydrogenase (NAD(+)), electron transfer subunit [uncultured Thermomicrobiales bacterium]